MDISTKKLLKKIKKMIKEYTKYKKYNIRNSTISEYDNGSITILRKLEDELKGEPAKISRERLLKKIRRLKKEAKKESGDSYHRGACVALNKLNS